MYVRILCSLLLWVFLCSFLILLVGLLTCKNCLIYNLYGVGGDVKPCSINDQSAEGPILSSIQVTAERVRTVI